MVRESGRVGREDNVTIPSSRLSLNSLHSIFGELLKFPGLLWDSARQAFWLLMGLSLYRPLLSAPSIPSLVH